jgi:very-short-patch-repair endonuclease
MRVNLDTKHHTKAERRFVEILKRNHIQFQAKVKICGREVDFLLLEKIAVEIGDHSQDVSKNTAIAEAGYSLLFLTNKELRENPAEVERHLLTNWIRI